MLAALVADLGPPGKVAKGEMKAHPQLLDLHNPTDVSSPANPTMSYGLASSAYRVHSIYSRTPTVPVMIQRDATVTLDYLLFLDTAAKDSDRGGDTDAIATLMTMTSPGTEGGTTVGPRHPGAGKQFEGF